jgi:hypothetical protein
MTAAKTFGCLYQRCWLVDSLTAQAPPVLPFLHDTPGARQPRAPAPGARPHRPGVRSTTRRSHDGRAGSHVASALLATVSRRVRRDPVQLPHDPPHRASNGAASRRDDRHRRLHGCRLDVARFVQHAIHGARRRDAECIPRSRTSLRRGDACVCGQDANQTEQDSRSRSGIRCLVLAA